MDELLFTHFDGMIFQNSSKCKELAVKGFLDYPIINAVLWVEVAGSYVVACVPINVS